LSRLLDLIRSGRGRVIVAIDDPLITLSKFKELVMKTKDAVSGFKLGLPYILSYGLDNIKSVITDFRDTYYIADLKLADIDVVMSLTTKVVCRVGFNGVIAHGFVGLKGGLDGLKSVCDELGVDLYIVTSMSHLGSTEIYDLVIDKVLSVVEGLRPTGVIAPATRPEVIRRVRNYLGRTYLILSPGVGAQGATPGSAICAGADLEIVGRAITSSQDFVKASEEVIKSQLKYLEVSRCY